MTHAHIHDNTGTTLRDNSVNVPEWTRQNTGMKLWVPEKRDAHMCACVCVLSKYFKIIIFIISSRSSNITVVNCFCLVASHFKLFL